MILQALYELAERENLMEDPDFEMKPIRYMVRIGRGGTFLGFQDTSAVVSSDDAEGRPKKKPKPQAKVFRIPRDMAFKMRAGSADVPGPLLDKREFVFGIPEENYKGEVKVERALRRRDIFRERVRDILATTGDEGVAAVLVFLERVGVGEGPALPDDCKPGDLFGFFYEPDVDLIVTERPLVRAWWKKVRAEAEPAGEGELQCLVSGEMLSSPGLFPKLERVPGVQGNTSLVSFNQSAFLSYGLSSNENAPVSRQAAEAVATAINRLLHPAFPVSGQDRQTLPPRSFRITADTAFCYWSKGSGEFEDSLRGLMEADESTVRHEVWTRLWQGKPPGRRAEDLSPFYGLIITGQTGRAILRGWFETTVGEAQAHVAEHFRDLRIVRNAPCRKGEGHPPAIALRHLLECIAPQGKQENIPPLLAGEVVKAALTGCLYPASLLGLAVERARAECGRTEWDDHQRRDARAALLKAVLNRRRSKGLSTHIKEVREDMDAGNTHPGYILGALMAVLERLQQEALDDVNASVVDKYFSGASASPRATFDRMVRNARNHARKAADGKNPGLVYNLERLIDALLARINVNDRDDRRAGRPIGFPVTLPIDEQGLFVIGYHHMRHWLWMNKADREAWEAENPDAPAAFRWQTRKNRPATPDSVES